MPRYLDEAMRDIAQGKSGETLEGLDGLGVGKEEMQQMAKMTVDNFGGLGKKTIERRREKDSVVALQKVEDALKHWISFFEEKYTRVGVVEFD